MEIFNLNNNIMSHIPNIFKIFEIQQLFLRARKLFYYLFESIATTSHPNSPQRSVQRCRMINRIACLVQTDRQIFVLQRDGHTIPGASHARFQHTAAGRRQVRTAAGRRRRRCGRRRGGRRCRRCGRHYCGVVAHMAGFNHVRKHFLGSRAYPMQRIQCVWGWISLCFSCRDCAVDDDVHCDVHCGLMVAACMASNLVTRPALHERRMCHVGVCVFYQSCRELSVCVNGIIMPIVT